MIDLITVLLIAVFVSGFSYLFIRLFTPEVQPAPQDAPPEEMNTEELLSSLETPVVPRGSGTRLNVYCIAALLCNCGVAAFMQLFYHSSILEITQVLLTLCALWSCAWIDGKMFLIPNKILLAVGAMGAVVLGLQCLLDQEFARFYLISSATAAVALLIATLLCRLVSRNALGMGDVKLVMLMGFLLRHDRVWPCIFVSMICSFFYSLFLLIVKKADKKTEIPFAPILLVGTLVASIITTV